MLKTVKSLGDSYEITLFYNNPNIHPRSEYLARLEALKKAIDIYNLDNELIVADWRPKLYFSKIKDSEGRCPKCWDIRIGLLFDYAKFKDFHYVSTTLLSSKYQNADIIKNIGKAYEENFSITFIEPVFCEKCDKTYGFYKQNYCGCAYSLLEKYSIQD